jgi:hypothetical protein
MYKKIAISAKPRSKKSAGFHGMGRQDLTVNNFIFLNDIAGQLGKT